MTAERPGTRILIVATSSEVEVKRSHCDEKWLVEVKQSIASGIAAIYTPTR
jgi:hypothetical protein